jgi:hypothetical protein
MIGQYWRGKPQIDPQGFLIERDWFRVMDISVDKKNVRIQMEYAGFLFPEVCTISIDDLQENWEKWEPNFIQKLLGYV